MTSLETQIAEATVRRIADTSTPSYQELAHQYRTECETALRSVLEIMDRAKIAGFVLGWNIAADPQGRHFLNGPITVARYF